MNIKKKKLGLRVIINIYMNEYLKKNRIKSY